MLPAVSTGSAKEQVVDNVPKRIKEIRFGVLSTQEIVNQAVIEVSNRNLYDLDNGRVPYKNGALDMRLGTSSKSANCETCGEPLKTCNGHFGHVKLSLPVFHYGYFRMTMGILQEICKECAKILLNPNEARQYLKELRRPGTDNLRKTIIRKKIMEQCRKTKRCHYCGAMNGVVKKGATMKIVHDKFRSITSKTADIPLDKKNFDKSFSNARQTNQEVDKHWKKALDDLNPLRVLNLFKKISAYDCELLGLNPSEGRPEMFIWQFIPVPPVCIRPSVVQDQASTEDDLTVKLGDIVHISSLIRSGLSKGQPVQTIMEQWEFLQLQVAMYINGDVPGLYQQRYSKQIRGFCQRLKGKQGRFRGNLSGKRVDFSGRTVISPDPNLGIDEVAVPVLVAKSLTYPERVSRYNIEKLRERVRNGTKKWPGANYIQKKDESYKIFLKFGNSAMHAERLQVGDIVERHIEDGDIVLFNRQPSLHKLSILSHYVKVRPWRTFRLNECVCTPYNADFDGDEMNLHVPQTEEARTEAMELMGVRNNLVTPKNGEPIIAAIQDFITAAYLLSSKDVFLDRKTFALLCTNMVDGNMQVDLPPPAVVKPQALWTGKQIFNVLMRPNKHSPVKVNIDARCREYRGHQPPDLCPNDGFLIIRNSEIMCGVMDKSTIGSGKKDSVFYVILRDFGPGQAVKAMNRLAKLSSRFLTNQGFSIGIGDVMPGYELQKMKDQLITTAFDECNLVIDQFKLGRLKREAGCNEEETMENRISGILSNVRDTAGGYCIKELSPRNAPLIMATCGSKGSNINVSQMIAVVGQQIINSKRVPDGFQDRSLPHFPKRARQPESKGFVQNSFFSGLTPTEFFFHAISGREGLVDTAVKTAETGYMSRRLMKSLEDLSTQYDDTVRNSASGVVQFQYGDDKLDPVDMEGKAKPVNFDRTWTHAQSTTSEDMSSMQPWEVLARCDELLLPSEQRLVRRSLKGEIISYNSTASEDLDEHESERAFLRLVKQYVRDRAEKMAKLRDAAGMMPFMQDPRGSDYEDADSTCDPELRAAVERLAGISEQTLRTFLDLCLTKYKRAQVEPGSAVGAVGAQSIGEPGTQMTLKTFHFAGVAGMSVTQGVPRIKEIINASKKISTPIITCVLETDDDVRAARIVKGRIEKTYLKDVIYYIDDSWSSSTSFLSMKIDHEAIEKLQLGLTAYDLRKRILGEKKLKLNSDDVEISEKRIRVFVRNVNSNSKKESKKAEENDVFLRAQHLKRYLPEIVIKGYSEAQRAVINEDPDTGKNELLVEGYGLKDCMTTLGVIGTRTRTNSVVEMREVLGIEAARKTIIDEIKSVMATMDIDPRHLQLLADVMTYKGEILGITRFGLAKMRDSVLQLASFEKTPDHLFDAAFNMKRDRIEGVSECIIMGQSMRVGTGAFQVVRELALGGNVLRRKETVFEREFAAVRGRQHHASNLVR